VLAEPVQFFHRRLNIDLVVDPTWSAGASRLDSAVTTCEGRSNRGRQDNDEELVEYGHLGGADAAAGGPHNLMAVGRALQVNLVGEDRAARGFAPDQVEQPIRSRPGSRRTGTWLRLSFQPMKSPDIPRRFTDVVGSRRAVRRPTS